MTIEEIKFLNKTHETYSKHENSVICSCGHINEIYFYEKDVEEWIAKHNIEKRDAIKYLMDTNTGQRYRFSEMFDIEFPVNEENKKFLIENSRYLSINATKRFLKDYGIELGLKNNFNADAIKEFFIENLEKIDFKIAKKIFKRYTFGYDDIIPILKLEWEKFKELNIRIYKKNTISYWNTDSLAGVENDKYFFDKLYHLYAINSHWNGLEEFPLVIINRIIKEHKYLMAIKNGLCKIALLAWKEEATQNGVEINDFNDLYDYLLNATTNKIDLKALEFYKNKNLIVEKDNFSYFYSNDYLIIKDRIYLINQTNLPKFVI